MTLIELNYDNAKQIISEELSFNLNTCALPFDTFDIQFPYEALVSYECLLNGVLKGLSSNPSKISPKMKAAAAQLVRRSMKESVTVHIEKYDSMVVFTVVRGDETMVKFKTTDFLPIPLVISTSLKSNLDAMTLAGKMIALCNSVTKFFNTPKTVKNKKATKEYQQKETKTSSAPVKKTYVYNTVYKYEELQQRHRSYNITSECWSVRGHWREYSNGKRVWINQYSKGKNRDKINQDKVYKITQELS